MGQAVARDLVRTVFKIDVPQMTVANGAAVAVSEDVQINGSIKQITVGIGDNTNDRTAVITLVDADGSLLFTGEAMAEATATARSTNVQQFMTLSGTDLLLDIHCAGTITVIATPSGDPGDTNMTIDISIYGD